MKNVLLLGATIWLAIGAVELASIASWIPFVLGGISGFCGAALIYSLEKK